LPGPREGRTGVCFYPARTGRVAKTRREEVETGREKGDDWALKRRSTFWPSENASENRRRRCPKTDRLADGLLGRWAEEILGGGVQPMVVSHPAMTQLLQRVHDRELVSRWEALVWPSPNARRDCRNTDVLERWCCVAMRPVYGQSAPINERGSLFP
jgi:hypothetical protein